MATQAATPDLLGGPSVTFKPRSFWWDVIVRLVRRKPLGLIGAVIVLTLIFVAVFAPLLTPYNYEEISTRDRLLGPGATYFFGTNNLGQDIFSRVIIGARTSLTVGFLAVLISTTAACLIGVSSAYFGGWVDTGAQRIVDVMQAFPGLILILLIMSVLGAGVTNVVLALGILGSVGGSRVIRSAALSIKTQPYVEAARTLGARDIRIIFLHILPNVMAPAITLATLGLGTAILAEASLSFLGYGVPPDVPTWGGMLSGAGRRFMLQAWWMAFFPGLVLSLAIFGFNMLGDALRDLLDPRLRGGR